MNAGSQQDQRVPEALLPGYVMPDDLTLAERIRLSVVQAGNLAFVTPSGRDGCWDTALLRDDSIILASLAAFPDAREVREFLQAAPVESAAELEQRVCRLLQRFDAWCRTLLASGDEQVRRIGDTMCVQVRQGLARLFSPLLEAREDVRAALHPDWNAAVEEGERFDWYGEPGRAHRHLRRCAAGLLRAVDKVRPLAGDALAASLGGGMHDPSMGLLLAMLQLYHQSRTVINRFPERLTRFYYRDVLQLVVPAQAPEKTHVVLVRDARFEGPLVVEAGTTFSGGNDEAGLPVLFQADQSVVVTPLRVVDLRCVRLEQDPLISPEREFDYVTRIQKTDVPVGNARITDSARWYPLFGGKTAAASETVQNLELGLALVSDMLLMQEGWREIEVRLQLAHPAQTDQLLHDDLTRHDGILSQDQLSVIFQHYLGFETRTFPLHTGPVADVPAAMAAAVWQRSAVSGQDVYLCFLVQRCLDCESEALFRRRLGRLFAAWLAASAEDLRRPDLDALRQHAARIGIGGTGTVEPDDPLVLIRPQHVPCASPGESPMPDRRLIFERLFTGAWRGSLSTATGWHEHAGVFVTRADSATGCAQICIRLRLAPGVPAICRCTDSVHGAQWPATAALRLLLQTQTRVYVYGILRQWAISDCELRVNVSGLRDLALYNQLGRLDASKPFQPFGPVPADGAYMVFGGPELSGKPLHRLQVNLKWGNLPRNSGGFAAYYAGYPAFEGLKSLTVGSRILMDGVWQKSAEAEQLLFDLRGERQSIPDDIRLTVPSADLRRWHRFSPGQDHEDAYRFDLHARNGFFRFDLRTGTGGFGHAEYPRLLTEALSRNSRKGKTVVPVPNEPYTPCIEQISADYSAGQKVPLGRSGTAGNRSQAATRLYHLNGFMLQPLDGLHASGRPTVVTDFAHDGNLFIGLDGEDPQGALTLFFHLHKEAALETWHGTRPPVEWAVWTATGWQILDPSVIVSDGTHGLLCSGVVCLNLPAGMERDSPQLPGQCYWLRLSVDSGFGQFAGLYGVYAHAVMVSRVVAAERAPEAAARVLPAGTLRQAVPTIAGLHGVLQPEPSVNVEFPAARHGDLPPRHAERLRHKLRAASPWDYERLVLEAFPEVFKVKCFPHQYPTSAIDSASAMAASQNRPGHVLVVVIPAPGLGQVRSLTEAPRIDVARLEAMRTYLAERCPAGVSVIVRNAAYERIQVRCCIQLVAGAHPGAAIGHINREIVEYLSPWHAGGMQPDFDWHVDAEVFEALIRALPEVAAVDNLSVLHVVRSDDCFYLLGDTARQTGVRYGTRRVRPLQPWSLVLPMPNHLIELRGRQYSPRPVPTGIAQLELGNTFIIGGAPQAEGPHGQ